MKRRGRHNSTSDQWYLSQVWERPKKLAKSIRGRQALQAKESSLWRQRGIRGEFIQPRQLLAVSLPNLQMGIGSHREGGRGSQRVSIFCSGNPQNILSTREAVLWKVAQMGPTWRQRDLLGAPTIGNMRDSRAMMGGQGRRGPKSHWRLSRKTWDQRDGAQATKEGMVPFPKMGNHKRTDPGEMCAC